MKSRLTRASLSPPRNSRNQKKVAVEVKWQAHQTDLQGSRETPEFHYQKSGLFLIIGRPYSDGPARAESVKDRSLFVRAVTLNSSGGGDSPTLESGCFH